MNNRSSIFQWRPHTTAVLIIGFVLVLAASVTAYAVDHFRPTVPVKVGGSGLYSVWVADTENERIQGLSGVKKLAPNGGLLMAFETEGEYTIWMKDMLLPIDVVWLDKDKKVIYLAPSLQPSAGTSEQYGPPDSTTRYILELPEGAIKKSAIRKGDTAQFSVESEAK